MGACETTNGSRPQHNNVQRPRPKIKDLELCGKLLLIQYPSQVILSAPKYSREVSCNWLQNVLPWLSAFLSFAKGDETLGL